ncbi:MAG: hypothetical protein GX827_01950 [Clostridiales bacterium]|jgi:hypothetical protein|nr:hypothetical protein [Clostridiales bacterium]
MKMNKLLLICILICVCALSAQSCLYVETGETGEDTNIENSLRFSAAPLGYGGYNLNIRIESDDLIQVSSKVQGDDDIILVHSPSSPDKVIISDWSVSNDFTTLGSFTLNVFPVGKKISEETRQGKLIQPSTLTDRKYYIDIKTFTPDLRPKVTAQLKLTVLKDDYYPWQEPKENRFYGTGEEQSRFVQIELVKYGFSDTALLDEFERYDELYG